TTVNSFQQALMISPHSHDMTIRQPFSQRSGDRTADQPDADYHNSPFLSGFLQHAADDRRLLKYRN
ncbi:MAG: hypothetical protein KDA96_27935, partial [Planctomycetaceae bacterium]|nr:hypothetical protein [Planctomycetaceae bacterium]